MSGFQHHEQLSGAAFLGSAQTTSEWALLDLGAFPGLVPGAGVVVGELYEVDEARLAKLDHLEGVPHFYRRGDVDLDDGRRVLAYILQPSAYPEDAIFIPGGSWRRGGQCSAIVGP